jgi:hypothetical protein
MLGGLRGLIDGKAPGRSPKLNGTQRQALARIIESSPIPAIHAVVRWRLIDLAQWVWEEYRIRFAKQTLSPAAAGDGLPQAVGQAAPPRSQPARRRGL